MASSEPGSTSKLPDKSVTTRLKKALDYLRLARTSRELSFSSVPFVVAAEHMIEVALERQEPDK